MTTADHTYALAFSDAERARYRLMAEQAYTTEADLWHRAGVRSGARVADVGCGPGALLPALARVTGRTGSVIGVDADPAAVRSARAYVEGSGLDRIDVYEALADDTGLAHETYDVVMMRHVLAHNGGREDNILAHLATLVRPGGSIYLVDVDVTGARMLPDDPDISDLGHRLAWHTARGNDMQAGIRLGDRLRRAGLTVEHEETRESSMPIPAGVRPPPWAARTALREAGLATDDDIARRQAAFDRLDALATRPVMSVPLCIAIGRREAR